MNIQSPHSLARASAPSGSAACLLHIKEEERNREHFKTDHLLANLKGRTISSGLVTTASQGAQFFLNLAYIMVVARLLVPQDFGLVAMVTTIMGFLRIFQDAGLSTATVQRQEITHVQVSNLFWVNVVVGGAITVLIAASAPAMTPAPALSATPSPALAWLRCPAAPPTAPAARASSATAACARARR